MGMKRLIGLTFWFVFLCPWVAHCASEFEEILGTTPIAVEVQTGRPEPNEFAGIVGSMQVNLERKSIYIAELAEAGENQVMPFMRHLHLKNMVWLGREKLKFDGSDEDNYEYTGEIWKEEQSPPVIGVHIVRKDSPRKIVNLSRLGREYLKRKKLSSIFLGIGQ